MELKNKQLCVEAELLIPQFPITVKQDIAHVLHSYLTWYENACKEENVQCAKMYEKWLKDTVWKAKMLLADKRYKESKEHES